jgi:BirA family biotin operon repressor/biotin-[acetyl-CoA-carboxylase] ligase
MRIEILKLLTEEKIVSGESLAKKLNVSRTAIWKQIKILQKYGYKIETVKNKGYRLISRPDVPIFEEITEGLNTKVIGKKIYYFKTIDSTNIYAKKLVKNGIEQGTIVVSDIQNSGRGRKNRSWSSPKGGLWFSVILYPNIPPQKAMLVTMASSVAVAQGIIETTGLTPMIKWPNDLLINNKKVCGILTELDAEMDKINYSIVGIGINVNNEVDDSLKDVATSLYKLTKANISRVKLLRSIIKNLDKNYSKLIDKDYSSIRENWISCSDIIGRRVQISDEKSVVDGLVTDVDENGCLILNTSKETVRVVSGDLTILI